MPVCSGKNVLPLCCSVCPATAKGCLPYYHCVSGHVQGLPAPLPLRVRPRPRAACPTTTVLASRPPSFALAPKAYSSLSSKKQLLTTRIGPSHSLPSQPSGGFQSQLSKFLSPNHNPLTPTCLRGSIFKKPSGCLKPQIFLF